MDIQLIADQPVTTVIDDALDLNRFVEILKESLYKTRTPFVYGVLGDWGTGKTSILHLLEEGIKRDLDSPTPIGQSRQIYIPIWFNAWKYENETNIVYPLLHAIKRSYEQQQFNEQVDTASFRQTFSKMVATTSFTITDVALRFVTKQLIDEPISLGEVQAHLETTEDKLPIQTNTIEKVLGKWADEVFELETVFTALLQEYAQSLAKKYKDRINSANAIRFIILVDDLDRCLPETAIRLLECLKNFLAVEKCIFVLAINPKIIYQGVKIKYQGLDVNGREYLEKILDYPFYVPPPSLHSVKIFTEKWLSKFLDESEMKKDARVQFGHVLTQCEFTNPRKVKRVLNRYLFFLRQYNRRNSDHKIGNVVRFIIMAEYFPDLFKLCITYFNEIILARKNVVQTIEIIDRFHHVSITSIYPHLLLPSGLLFFDHTPLVADNNGQNILLDGDEWIREELLAVLSIINLT